jgi:hypothetical protein
VDYLKAYKYNTTLITSPMKTGNHRADLGDCHIATSALVHQNVNRQHQKEQR